MENRFPKNLRLARKNKGYTQAILANKLSIEGANTISKWENGKQEPCIELLNKISEILDVSLDDLIKRNIPESNLSNLINLVPQVKLNNLIYDIPLPRFELNYSEMILSYYEFEDRDEEELFFKLISDYGGALHLDLMIKNPNQEISNKIINLYKSAYNNGEGILEAGLNLIRFLILKDIENQKLGKPSEYSVEVIELLYNPYYLEPLIHPISSIASFYRNITLIYGLYHYNNDKNEVENFIAEGYRRMIDLVDEGNIYATNFINAIIHSTENK